MDSSNIEFYRSSIDYILKVQNQDGSIPWEKDKKLDPWDHIEATMGLSVALKKEEVEQYIPGPKIHLLGYTSTSK